MHNKIILLIALFALLFPHTVAAQTNGPVYIVQSGDTLSSIAARFGVSMDDLMAANGITNPNLLSAGQPLVIPGLEGITGVLNTEVIGFGDSLRNLVRRTQIEDSLLRRLNHLVSPSELFVGASLIVPEANAAALGAHITPRTGESLLEIAVRQGSDPWTLAALNGLAGSWDALPGDVLYSPTGAGEQTTGGLPSAFANAEVKSLPLKQGGTAEIIVKPAGGVTLGGLLVDQPLRFFDMGDGSQVALQGVDVQLAPGVYPLRLDATLPDGSTQSFEQMVLVKFGIQNPALQSVPPMDPTVITSENEQVASIASTSTPVKYWQDKFSLPVGLPYCITEWFGTPRSYTYNGSEFGYVHSGVDYGVCSQEHPLDIYAAAPGNVVFVGLLAIRGNTTIVDNGWGIYTLYGHQSEMYVTVGQEIQAGETIGQIGKTGHVTGPHLHFEMWVNGVQVNPLDWLDAAIP
jgi:murein DD-endopeptidase MepM/ murein hydrolase activator NlpD